MTKHIEYSITIPKRKFCCVHYPSIYSLHCTVNILLIKDAWISSFSMTNSWNQNELRLPSDNSRSNSANLSLTSSGSFDMSILNSAMVNPFKNTHKLNRLSLHTHTIHQHRWPTAILNLRGMTSDSVFRCHYKAVVTHTSAIDTGKFNYYRLSNCMSWAGAANITRIVMPSMEMDSILLQQFASQLLLIRHLLWTI